MKIAAYVIVCFTVSIVSGFCGYIVGLRHGTKEGWGCAKNLIIKELPTIIEKELSTVNEQE